MKGGKYQILCVDDDQDILQTLKMILEKNGYVAVQASSAEEGYRKYQESQPDFVLVDLMMEQIDSGTNLVTKIKALGSKAPIYMLSSMGDEMSQTTNVNKLGLDGVFQKPIDPKTLVATLKAKLK
ncbi:MAG TPA: response regulator [Myxococcales bacterium]|jgi:DNA-binding response OmpR family regulator